MAISILLDEHYQPIVGKVPNYVYGRLLTPEDLESDRKAMLVRLTQIARATGSGIADGLWVESSGNNKQLIVHTGMGINRAGHPILLLSDTGPIQLKLPPDPPQTNQPENVSFLPCEFVPNDDDLVMQDGPYLLTAIPVYRLSEEAVAVQRKTIKGWEDNCENRWQEEGVAFRIVYLGYTDKPTDPSMNVPNGFANVAGEDDYIKRNRLAYWVYGTANIPSAYWNPFESRGNLDYSGFDRAKTKLDSNNNLTVCDLPLATFYWQQQEILFVDNWSVRRRLSGQSKFYLATDTAQHTFYPGWGQQLSDQVSAEGEARYMQFQDQLETIRQTATAYDVKYMRASEKFRYLPPAGFLPLFVSANLRQVITSYIVEVFTEEARKHIPQKVESNAYAVLLKNSGDHIIESEMNAVIDNINELFSTLYNRIYELNRQVGKTPTGSIYWIRHLQPYNASTPGDQLEVEANSHVILRAWNNFLVNEINSRLSIFRNLFNALRDDYQFINIDFPLLPIVVGVDAGTRFHIQSDELNDKALNTLNTIVDKMIHAINAMIIDTDQTLLSRTASDVYVHVYNNLFTDYPTHTKGVSLETFFQAKDDNGYTTNLLQNLVFVDRPTMNRMLEGTWRDAAIDLHNKDNLQNFDVVLVYEEVISYTASIVKQVIESDDNSFTHADFLERIWNSGLGYTIDRIIGTINGREYPPLYGLFTRPNHLANSVIFYNWSYGLG